MSQLSVGVKTLGFSFLLSQQIMLTQTTQNSHLREMLSFSGPSLVSMSAVVHHQWKIVSAGGLK